MKFGGRRDFTPNDNDSMPPPAKKKRVQFENNYHDDVSYDSFSSELFPSAVMTDDSEQSFRSSMSSSFDSGGALGNDAENNDCYFTAKAETYINDAPDDELIYNSSAYCNKKDETNDASVMTTTTMHSKDHQEDDEQVGNRHQHDDGDDDDESAWWETVQQEILNSNNAVCKAKLETLLECMTRRQTALERVQSILHQCVSVGLLQEHLGIQPDDNDNNTSMKGTTPPPEAMSLSSSESCFFRLVAGFHERMVNCMDVLEKDVASHLLQNHKRRQALMTALDEYQAASQVRYEHLMNRVVHYDGVAVANGAVGGPVANNEEEEQNVVTKDSRNGSDDDESSSNRNLLASQENPEEQEHISDDEWNEIMAQEPSAKVKHHMQVFLQGCRRWQDAQERFESAFDGLYSELTDLLQTGVMETFYQAMQEMNEQVELHLRDARILLGSNFERRAKLEQAIQRTEEQHQGMFANLMKRAKNSNPFNWMKKKNTTTDRTSDGIANKVGQSSTGGGKSANT